jgi:hypothetical protein
MCKIYVKICGYQDQDYSCCAEPILQKDKP